MKGSRAWSIWQVWSFPGLRPLRAGQAGGSSSGVTGLALNVEEHTVTQSSSPWTARGLEEPGEPSSSTATGNSPSFRWGSPAVSINSRTHLVWLSRLGRRRHQGASLQRQRLGHLYLPRVHARCPNRASTVRAHNWVVLGALLPQQNQPALFLPLRGLLYFRKANCPTNRAAPVQRFPFRTKLRTPRRAGPRARPRPVRARTWASSTAPSPWPALSAPWSSPISPIRSASTS